MNWKHVWIVFTKELIDTLRDRRTWVGMILLPLILIPIMTLVVPAVTEGKMSQIQEEAARIAVVGAGNAPELVAFIDASPPLDVVEVANPRIALEKGEIGAILYLEANTLTRIAREEMVGLRVEYDSSDPRSDAARAKLQWLLEQYANQIVAARLVARGLDPGIIRPFDWQIANVAPPAKQGSMFLSMILPMLLAMWAASGGMYAAIDGGAGEKERGTLEPLLAAPINRLSLVAGKYLTVLTSAMASAAIALLGMLVSFRIASTGIVPSLANLEMSVPVVNTLIMFIVAVFLAGVFAAVELAVSIFARSFKEAQTYLTPVSLVIVFPAIFTQLTMVNELSTTSFLIPVLNVIFVFKELIMGVINWNHIGITIAVSAVLIRIALTLTISMFRKETVLFRT